MKLYTWFTSSYLLMALFCCLLISGQAMGGPYIMYLVMGLAGGALHSFLGLLGLALVAVSHRWVKITGWILMVASVIRFFTQPGGSYNDPTFHQWLPLTTFILFALVSIVFLYRQIHEPGKRTVVP